MMIDWDKMYQQLADEGGNGDDENDVILAQVLGAEKWKAYCCDVEAEWELTLHLCRGGFIS
jgi:hypothetical protein